MKYSKSLMGNVIDFIVKANRKVTSDEIKERFDINESTTGNYNTRMLIKQAMKEIGVREGIPIGANGGGYFLITTYDEISKYRDNLIRRINGIEDRLVDVIQAWENSTGSENF
jgi:predicted transcriptional regulator